MCPSSIKRVKASVVLYFTKKVKFSASSLDFSTARAGGNRIYRFKTDSVSNGSALGFLRDNAGRTEFRYAAVFEGSSLKQLLVEVCDLAFDSSSCRGC